MKVLTEFTVELGWRKQPCVVRGLTKNYIRCYFIENDYYFNRDYIYGSGTDEAERYAFFAAPHWNRLSICAFALI